LIVLSISQFLANFLILKTCSEVWNKTFGGTKTKSMEEIKCVHCEARAQQEKEQEELNFSVLVSLVPLLVLTFFQNMNLL